MLGRPNTFSGDIYLDARPSRLLQFFLLLVYSTALLVVLWLPVAVLLKVLMCLLIVLSAQLAYRKHVAFIHPHPYAVKRVSWNDDEGWLLETRVGKHYDVVLDGSSFASRWLTVLNFRQCDDDRCGWFVRLWRMYPMFTVIVLPDNTRVDVLRRVGVQVRLLTQ